MTRPSPTRLPDVFAGALAALRADVSGKQATPLAVAFSGGLDSTVLLHLAHAHARQTGAPLYAFHVHHGLSSNADAWREHCRAQCAALGVQFDSRAITLAKDKSGVEAAARKQRYAALGAMCAEHGVKRLLTAHHLDDQAETVLLQLLRGAGMAGLSGMDTANSAPALLGNPDLVMARPLLPIARAALEQYAGEHGLTWVDDESNLDARYARNALRLQVMPALAAAFPGYQERFARSAQHAQSAQRILTEVAAEDLARVLDGEQLDVASLNVSPLRSMSRERVQNLIRHWFAQRGVRMPSTAWLLELVAQLIEARPGAQMLVTHPDCHLRRHRDRLHMTPKLADLAGMRDPDDEGIIERAAQAFRWQGEASLDFPDYGGVLHFDAAERGFESAWLRGQMLQIDFRVGGEKLKLAANRPTRSLKYHYQAGDVPAWERLRLPVVKSGKALLFAAGIGMDCAHLGEGGDRVALRWVSSQNDS